MKRLRVVFAGTPAFGLPSLEALADAGHDLVAVYTQPDKPKGRGQALQASPIKLWAEARNIPVYQPQTLRQESAQQELSALKSDVMVVIAYGLILPKAVLDIPRLGCINVHASILPRWRGASPIQHAILHGDRETGVCIMQMDVGLDTGAVYAEARTPIDKDDTAASLHDRLSHMSAKPLLATLNDLAHGHATAHYQAEEGVTYAHKIAKEDGHIQWRKPAEEIDWQIRAFNPWPMSYALLDDKAIRIIQARVCRERTLHAPGTMYRIDKEGVWVACGEGSIVVSVWQWPGKKAMSVRDWLNGVDAASFLERIFV